MPGFSSRKECVDKLNEAAGGRVSFALDQGEERSQIAIGERGQQIDAQPVGTPPKIRESLEAKSCPKPHVKQWSYADEELKMRQDPKFMDCFPCTCGHCKCLDCMNDPFWSYNMLLPEEKVPAEIESNEKGKNKAVAAKGKGKATDEPCKAITGVRVPTHASGSGDSLEVAAAKLFHAQAQLQVQLRRQQDPREQQTGTIQPHNPFALGQAPPVYGQQIFGQAAPGGATFSYPTPIGPSAQTTEIVNAGNWSTGAYSRGNVRRMMREGDHMVQVPIVNTNGALRGQAADQNALEQQQMAIREQSGGRWGSNGSRKW